MSTASINTTFKFYHDLPPWAKGVVIVGGGLVLYMVGYSAWNLIGKALAPAPPNLAEAQNAVSTVQSLAAQGETPTATSTQFQSWVNALVSIFNGCIHDPQDLEQVYTNLNNDADIYELIATFGTQSITSCLGFGGGTFSLSQCMDKIISASEIENVNSILATKGITFRFA
jgi:hypothetical protein